MNTKSRPAKNNYVPGSSRQPRSVATLRAQMEDLARGERIKARRQALRLTQPAVVDLLTQKAGAQVVTLRGYQAWEAGGGIRWDNAKVLADVLGVDAEKLMVGGPYVDKGETPDPFPVTTEDRLGRLEEQLRAIQGTLEELVTQLATAGAPAPQGELGRRATGSAPNPATGREAPRRAGRATGRDTS